MSQLNGYIRQAAVSLAVLAVMALTSAAVARADQIVISTPPGAVNGASGQPVNATATLTANGAGSLTIVVTNLIVNPNDVSQNISDVFFKVGNLTAGTLSSSSGQEVNVATDGTVSLGGTVSTGWILNFGAFGPGGATGFELTVLGSAVGPAHTIIGAPGAGGVYTNANGSIAGNDPHNPFLNQTATFTLNIPGLTSVTQISDFAFSFGTVPGEFVGTPVPEPTSMLLLGTGLVGLAGAARRRFRK